MYLYIVYNKTTKLTKIGITGQLDRRIGQIERSCGCGVEILGWVEIEHAQAVEQFLHATFDYQRKSGEWFKLNALDYRFLSELWKVYFSTYRNVSYPGECSTKELEKRDEDWMFNWRGNTRFDKNRILEKKAYRPKGIEKAMDELAC